MNSAESIPGRAASRRGGLAAIRCSAFLFDLDGVLIDSTPAVQRVWAQWAIEHGFKPDAVVAHAHGRPSLSTVRHFLPDADHELENREIERREIEDLEGIVVLPRRGGIVDMPSSTSLDNRDFVHASFGGSATPCRRVTHSSMHGYFDRRDSWQTRSRTVSQSSRETQLSRLRLRGLRRRFRERSVRQSCWDAGCSPAHNISRGPVARRRSRFRRQ
jgi:hypothetical protein